MIPPRIGTGHPGWRSSDAAQLRSAARIGWQVMGVCAALVVIGGAVILAVVFYHTTPFELEKPPEPNELQLRLNPAEVAFAIGLLAVGAVFAAGIAARGIARRAVRPLTEAYEVQRRFVADVSHELRTPLAVLDARAQQLALSTPDSDPRSELIGQLREDTRLMADVVDALLARATGPTAGSAHGTEVRAVVAAVTADLEQLTGESGVRWAVHCGAERVTMPAPELRRCITALLDNALAHSPAGGLISVTVTAQPTTQPNGTVALRVSDAGPGIRGIHPERVFDRAARGEPPVRLTERPRASCGIGLSLVRELCTAHGGTARVTRPGPGGTEFELILPSAHGVAA